MKAHLLIALISSTSFSFAQGPLAPPAGPPAPTQKSLQEIWDKLETQSTEITNLKSQVTDLQSRLSLIQRNGATTLQYVNGGSLPWTIMTVDQSIANTEPFLAFDQSGHPGISFAGESLALKLAYKDGVRWSIQNLSNLRESTSTALVFEPNNHPVIAYVDPSFRFAVDHFNESSWTTSIVAGPNVGTTRDTHSMAVGPSGEIGLAFNSATANGTELHFARYSNSSWTIETVDDTSSVGRENSLKYGPDGHPAISYYDFDNDAVKFARFDGSSWNLETVDGSPNGLSTSLSFGPDGNPAIAFRDLDNGGIKIARFVPGLSLWDIGTVATNGLQPSLSFGPDGQPAMAYSRGGDIWFSRFDGVNSWDSSIVESGSENLSPSLAFGPDGLPAIAYRSGDTLRFAQMGLFQSK